MTPHTVANIAWCACLLPQFAVHIALAHGGRLGRVHCWLQTAVWDGSPTDGPSLISVLTGRWLKPIRPIRPLHELHKLHN